MNAAARDLCAQCARSRPGPRLVRGLVYRRSPVLIALLIRWALIAVAFALTAWIVSGMEVTGGFWAYVWIALLFGIVNALLGTLLRI